MESSFFIMQPSILIVRHRLILLNRRALPITETELRLIAAAAIMGLRRMPKKR